MTIKLRRNSDGAIATISDPRPWSENEFIWTDGNYACDCNRYLFFERATHPGEEFDYDDFPCGDSAYSIVEIDGVAARL